MAPVAPTPSHPGQADAPISAARSGSDLGAEARMLLALLDRPGAEGRVREGRLVVYARRSGVTLALGSVAACVVERLLQAGMIVTDRDGAHQRYRLAPGGGAVRPEADTDGVPDDAEAFAAPLRNPAESPLAWLYRRGGWIGPAEFAAGERLHADLACACLLPRTTADWNRLAAAAPGAGLNPTEAMLAARQRVSRALGVVGSDFSGLLVDVCGFLKGLDQIEQERRWPARSAKVVLGMALTRLARHYGLSNSAEGSKGSRRVHRWSAERGRPAFVTEAGLSDQPSD
ncbi:MAG TPA: DUF6456 domain-containing protein [Beijerinckiaceae bacterium]|nr:DUF6456 domain-containing protein [Beijerinckiaceae bacterium]